MNEPNDIVSLLQRAGFDLRDQEYYRQHFQRTYDLDRLEGAQLRYLWATLDLARDLEAEFRIDLLTTRPTLAEQRKHPN